MSAGIRVPTDGGTPLGQHPFAGLSPASEAQRTEAQRTEDRRQGGLKAEATAPSSTPNSKPQTQNSLAAPRNRGRVDIKRTKAGRGGKTVTLVSGFVGIGGPEKEQLAKKIQKACGAGGTVKDGAIEIQGDQRETAARVWAEAGFRPVFAGG